MSRLRLRRPAWQREARSLRRRSSCRGHGCTPAQPVCVACAAGLWAIVRERESTPFGALELWRRLDDWQREVWRREGGA